MSIRFITCAVALAFCLVGRSPAQVPSSGEQPYNAALYKASHNSYARDESLAQQIDDYNVWQLELDVYDYDGKLFVNHDCTAPFATASTLQTLLQRMVDESRTYSEKFTMVYVDLKGDGGDGCQIGWGSTLPARLRETFTHALGASHIYPASEFLQRDQSRWPSYQALVRRGYTWGVIIDWHGKYPTSSEDLFFYATGDNPPPSDVPANTVLVNLDGGCDASPTGSTPALRNARWIYRGYPGSCGQPCQQLNGSYWTNLVGKRFTYLATNCVNWAHTFSALTQPPQPLFVDAAAAGHCPVTTATCDWGTRAFPFHDLSAALARATAGTKLVVEPGAYQLSAVGRPAVLRVPLVLLDGGSAPVILR